MDAPLDPKKESTDSNPAAQPPAPASHAAPIQPKPKPGFVPVGFSADDAPAVLPKREVAPPVALIPAAPSQPEPKPVAKPAVSASDVAPPAAVAAAADTTAPEIPPDFIPKPPVLVPPAAVKMKPGDTARVPDSSLPAGRQARQVDLDSILLPKKEAVSPASAMRVNAAAVLEAAQPVAQEQKPATPEDVRALAQSIRAQIAGQPAPAPTPAEPQAAPKPPSAVPAMRTYKSDIEDTVREKNISVVSMAAAEAARTRGAPPAPASRSRWFFIGGGTLLSIAAIGLLAYLFIPGAPDSSKPAPTAPLIYVDDISHVTVSPTESRAKLMTDIVAVRDSLSISLGLISRVYLTTPASDAAAANEVPVSQFLATLAPATPDGFVRALSGEYVLGVHVFDGNQPFLILKTDLYEQAFAGMLEWEPDMHANLSPLFNTPRRERIPEEGTTTPEAVPQLLETPLQDAIVENHDARVLRNSAGDIVFLWTFVDRQTLVITTNEYTLREIISRLKNPPVVTIPE